MTFSSLPASVINGAWVCPAGLACIPQIPYEYFALLEECTVAVLAEALDMSQLLASANAKIEKFQEAALKLVRPRISGSPRVIVNKDGLGRQGFGGVGGGWR